MWVYWLIYSKSTVNTDSRLAFEQVNKWWLPFGTAAQHIINIGASKSPREWAELQGIASLQWYHLWHGRDNPFHPSRYIGDWCHLWVFHATLFWVWFSLLSNETEAAQLWLLGWENPALQSQDWIIREYDYTGTSELTGPSSPDSSGRLWQIQEV